jgi:thiol:disulfide interchange protein DsbD
MKISLFQVIVFLFVCSSTSAQSPVSWAFSTKKLNDKVYEVHLTATIQNGWHLFAQRQPEGAIAPSTSFHFNKSPLLNMEGSVKEIGKLEKFKDEVLNISANQYSNKVDFVQVVKLKGGVKTAVTGKLEYQTCNDRQCMPTKAIPFIIALN